MTIGMVEVAPLAGTGRRRTARYDDIYLETHQFGCKRALALAISVGTAPFNNDVFPFHIAKLAQTMTESLGAIGDSGK